MADIEEDNLVKRRQLQGKYGKKDMLFYDMMPESLEGICEVDQESVTSSYFDHQVRPSLKQQPKINLSQSLYDELSFAYGRGDLDEMCDDEEFGGN